MPYRHRSLLDMTDYRDKHTFAICAYKECGFLEEQIESILNQTVKSSVLIETSTPNDFIKGIAEKYNIPLYINEGEGGITQDWNYAYNQCKTPYITIAHQDDKYESDYTETMMKAMEASRHPLIFFTNYAEIREGGKVVTENKLLKIKRLMLKPMENYRFKSSIWVRRRILSMGDPILCPSVTFAKDNLPNPVFHNHFLASEDWEAWEKLSKMKGDFLYEKKILSYHRIHKESTTTLALGMNKRYYEDYEMYCKFWPKWIAKILVNQYSKSEKSNEVDE